MPDKEEDARRLFAEFYRESSGQGKAVLLAAAKKVRPDIFTSPGDPCLSSSVEEGLLLEALE